MNGRIVWRVMWKEYRALRGLWIAVAIASWCTQLAALVWGRQFSLFELAATASLITPVFYVLGVAAVMLADERGPDADPLLRGLSTPVGLLATGKIAFLALSAVAMIPAAGALATVGLLWPGSAEPAFWHTLELIWAPAIVEGVAWGLFFSLLRRGAAHAIVFRVFAAAVALAVAMRYFAETIESDAVDYAWSLWLRLAMVAGIVLVDWTLARLWLRIRVANEFNAPEGWWGGLRFLAHRQHVDRRALGRVMWKEYRALRGMWIAVAAASWTAQLAVLALSRDASWFDVAFGAALVTPVFYALGAAAASFAGEREEGAADRFLVSLPLPIAPLVTGKILFLLLSTLAIVPVVSLTASISPWWPQAEYFEVDLYFIWGPAVLEVIAWGLLFSLLGRTVMQAAGLGAVAAALAVSVALWLTNDVVDQVDAEQYANALFARLGIVGLVLLADLALARQWLRASLDGERSGLRAWVDGLQAARQRAVGWALRPLRWQARLAWLAARQSAGAMALAVAAPIVLGLFVPIRHQSWFTEWSQAGQMKVLVVWEGNLVFLALLVGSMVFAADQRRRVYRCLAEQGANAHAFWFSRQAIGLTVLLLGVVAWHVAWWGWHGFEVAPVSRVGILAATADWKGITARQWALVAMSYGVGQAMSLFFRSTLVGTLVAIFTVYPFFLWYRVTTYLALPAAYTLWPLALGLLAATAVFVPRWLLDRRGPSTWLRVGGTFGFFACGVLALVPELRLSGIPDVPVDFDPVEFRATFGGDARETAKLYLRALGAMKPLDPAIDDASLDQHERKMLAESQRTALRARLLAGNVTDGDRQWLAANQRTIDLALEANERPTCAFIDVPAELPNRTREDLVNLLLLRGVAAENQIEATREAIDDVLRLIRHIRPFPLSAAALERSALEFIAAWSVWPGQTRERLQSMRELLLAYEQSLPSPTEAIKFHYIEAAEHVADLDAHLMPDLESWLRRAPWERARAERLLRERTNENLALVDMTLANLHSGTNLEWLRNYRQLVPHDVRYQTTPAFRYDNYMQGMGLSLSLSAAQRAASRRATQVILALGAFRLRTGALPETLADLEGAGVPPLPVDPYTGLSFRYFPRGFPVTVRPNVGLGEVGAVSWSEGQPLLWSPGLEVQVTETQENGSPGPGYSVADERGNFVKVENGLDAWVAGLSFRIPQ